MKNLDLTHHSSHFNQIFFFWKVKSLSIDCFSGACDKIDFDGSTLFLKCETNDYVYISGLKVFQFKTDDKNIDYISFMGNNMISYTFAVGENTLILYQLFTILLKTIKSKKELY